METSSRNVYIELSTILYSDYFIDIGGIYNNWGTVFRLVMNKGVKYVRF